MMQNESSNAVYSAKIQKLISEKQSRQEMMMLNTGGGSGHSE